MGILSKLTDPVQDLYHFHYKIYSEKATTMNQLAILSALAELHTTSLNSEQQESIFSHLKKHLKKLKRYWIALIKDYAVVTTQTKTTQKKYDANFFTFATVSDVLEYYERSWPLCLLAASSLIGTEFWEVDSDENEKLSDTQTRDPNHSDNEVLLMLGIACRVLSGPYQPQKAEICLKSLKNILKPIYLKNQRLITCKILSEILSTASFLLETAEDMPVRVEASSLLSHIVLSADSDYFEESQ